MAPVYGQSFYVHDLRELEAFLRLDPELNIYGIGDLDPFFLPNTCWLARRGDGVMDAAVLIYSGPGCPTVICLSREIPPASDLLHSVEDLLPGRFHAHLSPGLEESFGAGWKVEDAGEYLRMVLRDRAAVSRLGTIPAVELSPEDEDELSEFYRLSYPENWFDPRMLETGHYYGVRQDGMIVSAGGIHVVSEEFRVATLGNIATMPEYRGRGYGSAVTGAVCASVIRGAEHIGLNVRADNISAISCYRRLGFETVAPFGEYDLVAVDRIKREG